MVWFSWWSCWRNRFPKVLPSYDDSNISDTMVLGFWETFENLAGNHNTIIHIDVWNQVGWDFTNTQRPSHHICLGVRQVLNVKCHCFCSLCKYVCIILYILFDVTAHTIDHNNKWLYEIRSWITSLASYMPAEKRKELAESARESGFVMVNKKRDSTGRMRVCPILIDHLFYLSIHGYVKMSSDHGPQSEAPVVLCTSNRPRSGGSSMRTSAEYTEEFANCVRENFAKEVWWVRVALQTCGNNSQILMNERLVLLWGFQSILTNPIHQVSCMLMAVMDCSQM